MSECPFCNLDRMEHQEVIVKNDHCMFLQTPQEILVGSGLIVPIKHRETVFVLTEEEWSATQLLLQEVKSILDETYHPDGNNIGWVIPRFSDEPYAGKGIRHWLKSIENKRKLAYHKHF